MVSDEVTLTLTVDAVEGIAIYTYFGYAAHLAQGIELALATIMTLEQLGKQRPVSERTFDTRMATNLRLTLGEKVKVLRQERVLSSQQLKGLTKALRIRNRLAHWYSLARLKEAETPGGRVKMLDELDGYCKHLDKTLLVCVQLCYQVAERHGVTREARIELAGLGKPIDGAQYLRDIVTMRQPGLSHGERPKQ